MRWLSGKTRGMKKVNDVEEEYHCCKNKHVCLCNFFYVWKDSKLITEGGRRGT